MAHGQDSLGISALLPVTWYKGSWAVPQGRYRLEALGTGSEVLKGLTTSIHVSLLNKPLA